MRSRIITFFFASLLLITAACGPSEDEKAANYMAATHAAQQTATENVSRALAAVLTGTASVPTFTLTPTQTVTPTETAIPSATPLPMAEVIVETVYVRTGPGTNYNSFSKLSKGDQVEVTGRNLEGDWLVVFSSDGVAGWIPLEAVKLYGVLDNVAVVDDPATPIVKVTITIVNNMRSKLTLIIYPPADSDSEWRQTIGIAPGETASIRLTPDRYYFHFFAGGGWGRCSGYIEVTHDIYWEAKPVSNYCSGFQ
ncbi:MAG: SH3 domain-containing protein [Anaerolineae bacterium]|nr:SH3 domain-containing protein [Anaerolineae bacterium]